MMLSTRDFILFLLLAIIINYVSSEDCGHHSQILPDGFSPIHYKLDFNAHMVLNKFAGNLELTIRSHRTNNRRLILHSGSNINVTEFLLFASKAIESEEIDYNKRIRTKHICRDDKYNLIVIDLHEDDWHLVKNGSIIVAKIRYEGTTSINGRGLVRINYQSEEKPDQAKRFLFTHFERFGAHLVFPCFDEPKYKAKISFIMDQVLPPRRVASISRFKLSNWQSPTGLEFQRYVFETTPAISVHQFGFAMGFFEVPDQFLHSEGQDQAIQIVKYLGHSNLNQFATLSLRKAHWNINSFFGITHPAEVIKIICIPGIAAESFESFELAGTMIIDPIRFEAGPDEIETSEFTANLVRLLARQWFGYLLTLELEQESWLFDGLVGWTSLRITDKIVLGLSYKLIYAHTRMSPALDRDIQAGDTIAVKPDKVLTSLQTTSLGPGFIEQPGEFDHDNGEKLRTTRYLDERLAVKATSVISMAEEYCAGHFLEALQILLTNFAEKTIKLSDFYEALAYTCRLRTPRAVIESYIKNPGFPLIKATIDKRQDCLLVSQERLKLDYTSSQREPLSLASLSLADNTSQSSEQDDNQFWIVPLTYTQGNKFLKNKDKRLTTHLLPEVPNVIPIELPDKYSTNNIGSWIKLNNFNRGFYRILYSDTMQASLVHAVNETQLTILDYYQLIDDARALFRVGKVGSYYVIQMLKLMSTQRNEILQSAMISTYIELRNLYLRLPSALMISEQMDTFGKTVFGRIFVDRKFRFDLITTDPGTRGLLKTYELLATQDFEPIIKTSLEIYRNNNMQQIVDLFHDTIFIAITRHGTVHEFTGLLALLKHRTMQRTKELELKLVKAMALSREMPRLILAWRHIQLMAPDLIYHFILNALTTREGSILIESEVIPKLTNLYDIMEPEMVFNLLEQICINILTVHEICEPGSVHQPLLGQANWYNLVVNVREIRQKRYILSQIDLNKLTF